MEQETQDIINVFEARPVGAVWEAIILWIAHERHDREAMAAQIRRQSDEIFDLKATLDRELLARVSNEAQIKKGVDHV